MVLIPFTPIKASFSTQLGIYRFRFQTLFNDYEGVWHFDLFDETASRVIGYGIPILLGMDLLSPFNLGIGAMFAADMSGEDRDAGPDDLGERVIVGYYTEEEVADLAND
jgi:hypothetical protein